MPTQSKSPHQRRHLVASGPPELDGRSGRAARLDVEINVRLFCSTGMWEEYQRCVSDSFTAGRRRCLAAHPSLISRHQRTPRTYINLKFHARRWLAEQILHN